MSADVQREDNREVVEEPTKVGKRRLLDKTTLEILEIMKKAKKPVSIGYVAFNAKISWEKARALLFYLVATGLVEVEDTTKGYVFRLVRKE